MRILFVCIGTSVHSARWIAQLAGQGYDVHVINSTPEWGIEPHALLRNVTVHGLRTWCKPSDAEGTRKLRGFNWLPARRARYGVNRGLYHLGARFFPQALARKVAQVIDTIKPDLVHSLEFQHSSYLVLDAQRYLRGPMPKWWVANWGSDIYHHGHYPEHSAKISRLLSLCDYYSCETTRDIELGRDFGFRKRIMMPILPSSGGFDLGQLKRCRTKGPTSRRRVIVVKGYQGPFGRAITALKGIELCADVLGAYRVEVYSGYPETITAAEGVARRTGLSINCLAHGLEHDRMLALHGKARASIGLSITDGASISFLEALSMGSVPIQSYTAAPHEFITDGETGFIVDPDDPHDVARALRHIVASDEWVDQAAERNWETACRMLDTEVVRPLVLGWYRGIMRDIEAERAPKLAAADGVAASDSPASTPTVHRAAA